jgi:hypothetical protein
MKRITCIAVAMALSTILLSSFAATQTAAQPTAQQPPQAHDHDKDQTPLGDYARKVRKDPGAAKAKPKVFDNDNLPTDDKLSVIGQPPVANAATAQAEADKAAEPKTPAEDDQAKKQALWKEWQGKVATQKDQIDLASRELDVLQREYQLRAAAMYADAGNRIRNEAQWDKQDAEYKQKIADKQKAVDEGKQKLDDMKEEARKAGVPSAMIE